MLTLETTRRLGEVDRDVIAHSVKVLLTCLSAGETDSFVNHLAPDVVCFSEVAWDHARYPRPILGREAAREAFKHRATKYMVLGEIQHRLLVDGDQAVVHRSLRIAERGGGQIYEFSVVNFLRFRDGLVVEFQELPDGAAREVVLNFPH